MTTWTTKEIALDFLSRLNASGSAVNIGREISRLGLREIE
jgi:hypothetical protein